MAKKKTIDLNTMLARVDGTMSCDLYGEVVLLSIESESYYQIDDIGSQIWVLLETPQSGAIWAEHLLRVLPAYELGDQAPAIHSLLHYADPRDHEAFLAYTRALRENGQGGKPRRLLLGFRNSSDRHSEPTLRGIERALASID